MRLNQNLTSDQKCSPRLKPDPSPVPETLSPSEREALQRDANETSDYARKAFGLTPRK